MSKPLEGIRVTDFSWVGAGSYTTKILADLGAEVFKIESAAKVDGIRLSPPFAGGKEGVNRSGYFADRNTSKKSITLNMKVEGSLEVARQLIASSHVVCNNFSSGVMERLGLGFDSVKEINSAAVYLAMSMNGNTGPERTARGYGLTMSAATGFHHLSGNPGQIPLGSGTNYPDHIPNPGHAAFAIMAALRHARKTGVGQMIDIAQTEAMLAVLGPEFMELSVNGDDRQPQGNWEENYVWQSVLQVKGEDRWVAVSAPRPEQYQALLNYLSLPADLEPAVATVRISHATSHADGTRLVADLQALGIPAGQVHDARDVIGDAQLVHREHWQVLEHPEAGKSIYSGQPFKFSDMVVQPETPAPLLGQHTEEICRKVLGYSAEKIAALRASGALT